MEHLNNSYIRCHSIRINSNQTRELDLLLSFVFYESLDNENWREIKGLNGRYFISSCGRVLSLCLDGYKLLKPFVCGDGYYYVDLRKDGQDIKSRVHRLVAEAFIDNPENKQIVHHKDLNKQNNNVSNLEWLTYAEHASIHKNINQERMKQKEIISDEALLY